MKACAAKRALVLLIAGLLLGGTALAWDNDGCSNASLKGDYSFTIHGETLGVIVPGTPPTLQPFPVPVPADGVAITEFNGQGGLSQVDFVMRGGMPAITPTTPLTSNGFRSNESGHYNIAADCTGHAAISFPDGSEIDLALVVTHYGREIHTVVTRQHVPFIPNNAACASGCDLGVQIRSDAWRTGALELP